MKQVHVFDCDGVLVSSLKRYSTITHADGRVTIDLEAWRANQHLAMQVDELLPLADYYQHLLCDDANAFVIIATARYMAEDCPQLQYIQEVLGMPHALIYRTSEEDNRRGYKLKLDGLRSYLNLKQFQSCEIHIWEDNAPQLAIMVDDLYNRGYNVQGHYIPSKQGH